jgi:NAD(P)-dependent dehydrogenase (short-subunit alcohol dehydrogenase family)
MAKHALIWGADGGIGQAITRLLVEEGWQIVAAGRNLERLEDLEGIVVEADFSQPYSIQQAVSTISQEVDEIHLWVYAVGDIVSKKINQMAIQDWQRILEANLTGAFLATHYSWPLLAKEAHLFYLGAMVERLHLPGMSAYVAAKAGLDSLAEVVAKESRCRVTVVRPSAVATPLWEKTTFKLPPNHLNPADAAIQLLQAYQEGTQGKLDI